MKDKTIKIIKIGATFALAFLFVFTALYGYSGNFEYAYELTFLSNFLAGCFCLLQAFCCCLINLCLNLCIWILP